MNTKHLIKILLIVLAVQSLILVTIFIGMLLIFWQDQIEDKCELYVSQTLKNNPYELMDLSEEEKKNLGIDQGLTPVRQHYEIKKCMKNKSYLDYPAN